MMEILLRYGLNPHQHDAKVLFPGEPSPLRVLNGAPGFINMLDAFGSWQLARKLREATGLLETLNKELTTYYSLKNTPLHPPNAANSRKMPHFPIASIHLYSILSYNEYKPDSSGVLQ
jgi:hypothetical protein